MRLIVCMLLAFAAAAVASPKVAHDTHDGAPGPSAFDHLMNLVKFSYLPNKADLKHQVIGGFSVDSATPGFTELPLPSSIASSKFVIERETKAQDMPVVLQNILENNKPITETALKMASRSTPSGNRKVYDGMRIWCKPVPVSGAISADGSGAGSAQDQSAAGSASPSGGGSNASDNDNDDGESPSPQRVGLTNQEKNNHRHHHRRTKGAPPPPAATQAAGTTPASSQQASGAAASGGASDDDSDTGVNIEWETSCYLVFRGSRAEGQTPGFGGKLSLLWKYYAAKRRPKHAISFNADDAKILSALYTNEPAKNPHNVFAPASVPEPDLTDANAAFVELGKKAPSGRGEEMAAWLGSSQDPERKEQYNRIKEILEMVQKIMAAYPGVKNWYTSGHSLGGALAQMVAHKYQLRAVVFSSPGSRSLRNALYRLDLLERNQKAMSIDNYMLASDFLPKRLDVLMGRVCQLKPTGEKAWKKPLGELYYPYSGTSDEQCMCPATIDTLSDMLANPECTYCFLAFHHFGTVRHFYSRSDDLSKDVTCVDVGMDANDKATKNHQ